MIDLLGAMVEQLEAAERRRQDAAALLLELLAHAGPMIGDDVRRRVVEVIGEPAARRAARMLAEDGAGHVAARLGLDENGCERN